MTDPPIDDLVATSQEGLREQALQRVKKRREFHTHLFAYLTINVLLWESGPSLPSPHRAGIRGPCG